jgi:carboxyl-terminal processing protease
VSQEKNKQESSELPSVERISCGNADVEITRIKEPRDSFPPIEEAAESRKGGRRFGTGAMLLAICLTLVTSVLLTYTFTAFASRRKYTQKLLEQQKEIDRISGSGSYAGANMQILDQIIREYSYYAGEMDGQAMLEAAFKAYVEASGDRYAEYYTEEEYRSLFQSQSGSYSGIGVTAVNDTIEIEGQHQKIIRITRVREDSPAKQEGILAGDCIYALYLDGQLKTVEELDYNEATNAIGGEAGTYVRMQIYRPNGDSYTRMEFTVQRREIINVSASASLLEWNPKIGIVTVTQFNRTTPQQFKQAVNSLLEQNVEHFIFDVRDNPGGDLKSITAILSYFLQEGDLILTAEKSDGTVDLTVKVAPMSLTGDYLGCSVGKDEIGMYANLDVAVLCNENTASAAEVFAATFRDYDIAPLVGEKTFGKGIMQTTRQISFQGMVGYIKLTTHAYFTKSNESYHGKGIEPDVEVRLGSIAEQYPLSELPQMMDDQLKAAANLFS